MADVFCPLLLLSVLQLYNRLLRSTAASFSSDAISDRNATHRAVFLYEDKK